MVGVWDAFTTAKLTICEWSGYRCREYWARWLQRQHCCDLLCGRSATSVGVQAQEIWTRLLFYPTALTDVQIRATTTRRPARARHFITARWSWPMARCCIWIRIHFRNWTAYNVGELGVAANGANTPMSSLTSRERSPLPSPLIATTRHITMVRWRHSWRAHHDSVQRGAKSGFGQPPSRLSSGPNLPPRTTTTALCLTGSPPGIALAGRSSADAATG